MRGLGPLWGAGGARACACIRSACSRMMSASASRTPWTSFASLSFSRRRNPSSWGRDPGKESETEKKDVMKRAVELSGLKGGRGAASAEGAAHKGGAAAQQRETLGRARRVRGHPHGHPTDTNPSADTHTHPPKRLRLRRRRRPPARRAVRLRRRRFQFLGKHRLFLGEAGCVRSGAGEGVREAVEGRGVGAEIVAVVEIEGKKGNIIMYIYVYFAFTLDMVSDV